MRHYRHYRNPEETEEELQARIEVVEDQFDGVIDTLRALRAIDEANAQKYFALIRRQLLGFKEKLHGSVHLRSRAGRAGVRALARAWDQHNEEAYRRRR